VESQAKIRDRPRRRMGISFYPAIFGLNILQNSKY